MLQNKVAVVTGSTSGIGLGIAEALAADGASIMLNGFGEPDHIAALRKRLEQEHGARVGNNDADMTVPADVAGLIEQTTRDSAKWIFSSTMPVFSLLPPFTSSRWRPGIG
jgi:3-hydroxybutyrate dehydrogenase